MQDGQSIKDPSWIGYGPPEWDEPDPPLCRDCNGTGKAQCPVCKGLGAPEDAEGTCDGCEDALTVPCETCNGTGEEIDDGDY